MGYSYWVICFQSGPRKIPGPRQTLTVTFTLPASWSVSTVERRISSAEFTVTDLNASVFFVGKDVQELGDRVKGLEFTLATSGQWAFSPQELLTQAKSIMESHGRRPGRHAGRTSVAGSIAVSAAGRRPALER